MLNQILQSWWLLPLAVTACAGVCCPVLGTLLVSQRRVLSTQSMAYGVLPGVVLAAAVQQPPLVGGWLAALLSLVLAEALARRSHRRDRDALHSVVLAGSLSLGVLLLHHLGQETDLNALLFGDLLVAGLGDLVSIGIGLVLLLLLVTQRFEPLLWLGVDPQGAADAGVSLRQTQRWLTALSAWILVTTAQALGVALVMALVCGPAMLALGLARARGLAAALGAAAAVGTGLSISGFGLALAIDWPPGPTIALLTLLTVVGGSLRRQGA